MCWTGRDSTKTCTCRCNASDSTDVNEIYRSMTQCIVVVRKGSGRKSCTSQSEIINANPLRSFCSSRDATLSHGSAPIFQYVRIVYVRMLFRTRTTRHRLHQSRRLRGHRTMPTQRSIRRYRGTLPNRITHYSQTSWIILSTRASLALSLK